ncbi:hypothetical protein [Burkholderia territorii]|uniref:hypothetical protein n=1 Tax=Burkholderia territorii TaxID=1503055 RepID=UPI00075A5179|nr:hypothetical protein [Burkholderia territorii]KVQ59267.1 hypothetical protein WT22_18310 [Burkholderia territorii]KWA30926.1 hypothetical protein WT40_21880 [Burkholderia territorii]
MPPTNTLDVRLDPKAIRLIMDMPRTLLAGEIPMPQGLSVNRRAVLENAQERADLLRSVFLGLSADNDLAAFYQLRDEVAEFGKWVESQLKALDAAEAK